MSQRPKSIQEYQTLAKKLMKSTYWNYYDLPGEGSQTYFDSIAAFRRSDNIDYQHDAVQLFELENFNDDECRSYFRYKFRPHVLNDVSSRSLSTTLLGLPVSSPIGVAPSALHRFAHKDAEIGTAKGASKAGSVMIQSSFSNTHVKKVSEAVPNGVRWMQLYIFKEQRLTRSVIREAEKAGYSAIVLTVDSPATGWNIDDFRELFGYDRLLRYKNLEIGLPEQIEAEKNGDLNLITYYSSNIEPKVTWEIVGWIKRETSLPVVCKGILTARAAKQAADAGADAIIVSAHGGRQLDGVPAPIDALSEVVESVRGRNVEVYMDGGVRTGSDVLKALAMGAKAVFVGRPALWGLACEGAEGVRHVLEILRNELDFAMGLCGCTDVNAIPPDIVIHQAYYNTPKHKL